MSILWLFTGLLFSVSCEKTLDQQHVSFRFLLASIVADGVKQRRIEVFAGEITSGEPPIFDKFLQCQKIGSGSAGVPIGLKTVLSMV